MTAAARLRELARDFEGMGRYGWPEPAVATVGGKPIADVLAALADEVERLAELRTFAQHDALCSYRPTYPDAPMATCDCGFDAALAAEGWTLVDAHNALNRVDEQVVVLAERIAREERAAIRAAILQLDHDCALNAPDISDMDTWGDSEMNAAQSIVAGILAILDSRDKETP